MVWGGEEVFVLVHLVEECGDVGGLVVGELVVVVECVARVCKELVVSFPFTLSFCSSFLLFGLWGWVFLVSEGSHVVEGDVVGSDGRVENVQWGTMFGVKGGLEVFG